jgi:3-methyladenine DNA glycosylase/8-oxoguanine DNA glycosylase
MTPKLDPLAIAVQILSERDPRLGEVIARVGPCGLGIPRSEAHYSSRAYFESLAAAIVGQQLSAKAAATIFSRVRALGPDPSVFPSPAELLAIPEPTLRAAGLSAAKATSVRDLAGRVVRGELHLDSLEAMDDDAVIEELCMVKGIGRWTAEMFLMFRLGRLDVLPVADLGIQKGIQRLFNCRKRPSPDRMRVLTRAWRPYRSVACWYLWRLPELDAKPAKER